MVRPLRCEVKVKRAARGSGLCRVGMGRVRSETAEGGLRTGASWSWRRGGSRDVSEGCRVGRDDVVTAAEPESVDRPYRSRHRAEQGDGLRTEADILDRALQLRHERIGAAVDGNV